MTSFIILGMVLIGIFVFFKRVREYLNLQKCPIVRSVEYTLKPLLTPAELSFYRELRKNYPVSHLQISCKTRLEDIIHIYTDEFKDKFSERNKIKSRHIDFMIWYPENGKIACAIELDDQSHQTQKVRVQDEFKNRIFQEIKIKLFRKKVSAHYDLSEIEDYIDPL